MKTIEEDYKRNKVIYSKKQIIKNAIKKAEIDKCNQTVIACDDGIFTFCREAYGKPTVPIFDNEHIIGRVITGWIGGILHASFIEEAG